MKIRWGLISGGWKVHPQAPGCGPLPPFAKSCVRHCNEVFEILLLKIFVHHAGGMQHSVRPPPLF